ncbi:CDP-glycerol glycerophosphotransferase family protein [Halostella sp. PRR32]|uniref:CDP-glycerol glycerophosphotransferase family protein n=1 Tax=Halostella sp. PRR32 TaxID=3098147 RepID=UPI002B1E7DAF|nr:CDP-glycerol glycerophosphotransferase family protein [Halostella sp. PRR32]
MGAFGVLLSLLAHRLAVLFPRRDDVWAFGSRGGTGFEGNTKYQFLHVANRDDTDVRPVWITEDEDLVSELRDEGYGARRASSLRGIWTLLRAGRVFVTGALTDVPIWPTGGAEVVQLWHGVPLKRISTDSAAYADASLPDRLAKRYVYRQFDWVTVTSAGVSEHFASAFRLPLSRMAVTGYPRTDVLWRDVPGATVGFDGRVLDDIADFDAERVVAYFPTYRNDPDRTPASALDFAALDAYLADRDAALLLKFHPADQPDVDLDDFDQIRRLPSDADPYPLLEHVDVLLTDYSSIYFEFLLLDRPVAFYAYDLPAFEEANGLYFEYDEYAPGPVATDFDGLTAALDRCFEDPSADADHRRRVRDEMFDHRDGRSAERVCALVEDERDR